MFYVHIHIHYSISSICVRFCKHSGTALGCMLFAFENFLEYFVSGTSCTINIDVNLCDYMMATLHDMAHIEYVST